MNVGYIWNRIARRLVGTAISNSQFDKPSKAQAGSTVINSKFGSYSYCGFNCLIANCEIGKFCSIADNVSIGDFSHPVDWVSTSPAFYKGRDSIPKDLAVLKYDFSSKKTIIGNDVWIGKSVLIKGGVRIGDGVVVGMGSIVTHDLEAYGIYAGNPARLIRKRFSDETIGELMKLQWWNMTREELIRVRDVMNSPERFVELLKKEGSSVK
ncbi:transferase hexapeptide (six repeat-containing protein) [Lachnospiraceae bacterium XBD2001]|nr:transferase hexapeptide (six repeat-containing protein) [Lachnospiraceae bacterium XBD2001]